MIKKVVGGISPPNLINSLNCYIKSYNYNDLMNIKSNIKNLSQIRNINYLSIALNSCAGVAS